MRIGGNIQETYDSPEKWLELVKKKPIQLCTGSG
jgi:hypothetical protein